MQLIRTLGTPIWNRQELLDTLPDFAVLYEQKFAQATNRQNQAKHYPIATLFMLWFTTKKLQPKHLIISTAIEKIAIEPLIDLFKEASPAISFILTNTTSKSIAQLPNLVAYKKDFAKLNKATWKDLDKKQTLIVFDDHQNGLKRLQLCKKLGFKYLVFPTNYPAARGDYYSLKKVFMHTGFTGTAPSPIGWWEKLKAMISPPKAEIIPPNADDATYLKEVCKVYDEFPPIFRANNTQWGDAWIDFNYPSPLPLLTSVAAPYQQLFKDTAEWYDWACYVELK